MFDPDQRRAAALAAALFAGVMLLYWPAANFDFINFDDPLYVAANTHVTAGFNRAALRWCFQAGYAGNWHPLTWMSHMLDCRLFGLRPGPPHVVNALLHAANSALLFLILNKMTRAFWRSAWVAALFACHPLHVESVAWIAERKDVLSALFWMLAIWAYLRHAQALKSRLSFSKTFYGACIVFFALGLMAKPMVLTLPFVLLLLDGWPLARLQPAAFPGLILEKLPLFILAAGSAFLTTVAQLKGGALATTEYVPFLARILNAVLSDARYVGKLIYPASLSVFYPVASSFSAWQIAAALALLGALTAMTLVFRKTRPWWLVGWLWYLGVLFPVIGLVQVGGQSMADRYAYLPSIGLFIILSWEAGELSRLWRAGRALIPALALALLALCAAKTHAQLMCWQNSETLFTHALAIDPDNYLAHACYGCYLRDKGQLKHAQLECQRAVEIAANYMPGYTFLCGILELEGRNEDAMAVLRHALKVRSDNSGARCDLARLLSEKKEYQQAENELRTGLQLDPDDPGLHLFLARTLALEHKDDAAQDQFAQSVRLAPLDPACQFQWALALAARHQNRQAIAHYRAALILDYNSANTLNNLAWLLASSPDPLLRDGPQAVQLAARACALSRTNDAVKIGTLANACAESGRFEEAAAWARRAQQVALAHGQTNVAEQNRELEKLYQARRAFYEYY
jgi:tetratricopeptide (TPR) repeat protein